MKHTLRMIDIVITNKTYEHCKALNRDTATSTHLYKQNIIGINERKKYVRRQHS